MTSTHARDSVSNKTPHEWAMAIHAIADGYPVTVWGDRWIRVTNPDFQEGNGSNPALVIDAQEFGAAMTRFMAETKL